jgi:hypothetical protein
LGEATAFGAVLALGFAAVFGLAVDFAAGLGAGAALAAGFAAGLAAGLGALLAAAFGAVFGAAVFAGALGAALVAAAFTAGLAAGFGAAGLAAALGAAAFLAAGLGVVVFGFATAVLPLLVLVSAIHLLRPVTAGLNLHRIARFRNDLRTEICDRRNLALDRAGMAFIGSANRYSPEHTAGHV